jgi:hypothetical protein
MKPTYFWYQDTLVTIERDTQLLAEDFNNVAFFKYRYCFCVDTFEDSFAKARYGIWIQVDTQKTWPTAWESRPLSSFPAEFRAQLLLLGVQ